MRKSLLVLLIGSLAALGGAFSYHGWQQKHLPRIDFALYDMDGELRQAQEFDGKLVLLNFWAPWCAPCRAEIPMLNELQQEYAAQGLQILGPVVDEAAAVGQFTVDTPISYPVLLDLPAVMRLQDAYGEPRLPFSVLINRRGRVVYRHAGELKRAEIEPLIQKNL